MTKTEYELKVRDLESQVKHYRRKSVRLLKAIHKAVEVLDDATKLRDEE